MKSTLASEVPEPPAWVRRRLHEGLVIPAHPLALTSDRRLDVPRQRALTRYYHAAGAGGIAVGVHTTQFAIRDCGLLRPVLELARETALACDEKTQRQTVCVAGLCGSTSQAKAEAALASRLGYHAGLLSLGSLKQADEISLIAHCRAVASELPLFGFYLQPAAGGRLLTFDFWRRFAAIPNVVAIKIAPFNRYQTLDVIRAVVEAGRSDIALYTGNDDNIVLDLLTPYRLQGGGGTVECRVAGGLLGHWAFWTERAVDLLERCRRTVLEQNPIPTDLLALAVEVTDANAAIFDATNGFAGCIPGIHEVLCRQGLLATRLCLNPAETLSPGQREEIDRVWRSYPHLNDDAFVKRHLDEWLS